jgi:peptidoglycan/LPS O-acetylase OafA/YrhL
LHFGSLPTVGKSERVASLDLCRGAAAFAVAVPHYLLLDSVISPAWESVAVLAVEVFFVLSGFVLAPQILHCLSHDSFRNLKIFLVRRWMRTVPAYLLSLGLITILLAPVPIGDFVRYAIYSQNLYAQLNSQDYYPIAWSLSVEEWFYIGFPLFMIAALRWIVPPDRRKCATLTMGFIVLISITRGIFGDMSNWGEAVRRVVVFRVDAIAYGFMFYLLAEATLLSKSRVRYNAVTATIVFAIAAAAAIFGTLDIAFNKSILSEYLFPFYAPVFGIATLFFFYSLAPLIESNRVASRFSGWLGRISYSAYLFHFVIARMLHAALAGTPMAWQLGLYVICICGFCSLFYLYFERPILSARPRYADLRSMTTGLLPLKTEFGFVTPADHGEMRK